MLALIITFLCEVIGIWFVNNKMIIPEERLIAANWTLQLSILTFCSSLLTIPYNAAIIAHERMKAFAYVSIYEGIAKLIISYLILISPFDILIFYALMLFILQVSIQSMYRYYCHKHFEECKYKLTFDTSLYKEMSVYAGWNFIGSLATVLRNQGNNLVLNIFFGPVVNAARAIANQVLHAVEGFSTNFMTAVKPQITQSYANKDLYYMQNLIYRSAKLSFFMLLIMSLPIIFNVDYILKIWLKNVPNHSSIFIQLTLIYVMVSSISNPLTTAQLANGNIRNYQIVIGGLQLLNLPISYILLRMHYPPETILYVAITLEIISLFIRLLFLKALKVIYIKDFINKVLGRIIFVTIISLMITSILSLIDTKDFITLILKTFLTFSLVSTIIIFIGCDKTERQFTLNKLHLNIKPNKECH